MPNLPEPHPEDWWADWPQVEPAVPWVDFDPDDAEPWQILGPDGEPLVNIWRRIGFAQVLDLPTTGKLR